MTKITKIVSLLLCMLMLCVPVYAQDAQTNTATGNTMIYGRLSPSDCGKAVSILLKNANGETVHIGMTEVDENGEYAYKFSADCNISECELKIKLENSDVTQTLTGIVNDKADTVNMDVFVSAPNKASVDFSEDEKANFKLILTNKFGNDTSVSVVSAFYDKDGRMLDVFDIYNGNLTYFDFSKELSLNDKAIPKDAVLLKVFCFDSLGNIVPLSYSFETENGYGTELYVSSDGSQNGDGSIENPFSSIEKAQDKIKELKAKGNLPKGGITVYLREGKYSFIDRSLTFGAEDAGSEVCPVTYKAYNNEDVRITGGSYISGSQFSSLSSNDGFYSRFSDEAKTKIKKVSLKDLGISGYDKISEYGVDFGPGTLFGMKVFEDDEECIPARYPNTDEKGNPVYVYSKSVVTNADSQDENTKDNNPVIEVSSETAGKVKAWLDNGNSDVICEGWFKRKYSCNGVKVTDCSTTANTVTLSKAVSDGYSDKDRFFFQNIPEELDCPGEYYIDRTNGALYYYPSDSFSESSTVCVTVSEQPLLTMYEGADYISFDGICFELSKQEMVKIDASKNIGFYNCTFKNSNEKGILAGGTYLYENPPFYGTADNKDYVVATKNITVESCTFKNLGGGGIIARGGSLNTLERANLTVNNCSFYKCDTVKKNYSPAVFFKGCGASVTNCKIENQNGMAIEIGGADIRIAYNDISNVVKEADDCGAIYAQKNILGTDIVNNSFSNIPYNVSDNAYYYTVKTPKGTALPFRVGVYVDGYRMGGNIRNNIFRDMPFAFHLRSYGHTVQSNIFIDVFTLLHSSQNYIVKDFYLDNSGELFGDETTKILQTITTDENVGKVWSVKIPSALKIADLLKTRANTDKTRVPYTDIVMKDNLVFYDKLSGFYNSYLKCADNENRLKSVINGYDDIIGGGNTLENMYFTDDKTIFKDYDNNDYSVTVNEDLYGNYTELTGINFNGIGLTK